MILRSLTPLRVYNYTQGMESDKLMGSQLIMAARNATFLQLWYKSYLEDYKEGWTYNALIIPMMLSKRYPSHIHIEGYNFTRPNWFDRHLIYYHNYDWSDNYAIHLFIRDYKRNVSLSSLCTLNTTIGSVGRHAIFGRKGFC